METKEDIILQNIIFCNYANNNELYFRTNSKNIICTDKSLSLNEKNEFFLSFDTYFNAFSLFVWKLYSILDNLELSIEVKGEGRIELIGIDKLNKEFFIKKIEFNSDYNQIINIKLPKIYDFILVYFRIYAKKITLYSGVWKSIVSLSKINNVVPAIGICTWKKEKFIKNIVKKILDLNADNYFKEKIYIHIADNGQTLNKNDFFNERIFLHSNVNAGGSGGFARCMLEVLHQTPQVTHLLLMDDDIELEAESIYRTFTMYKLIKEKYKNNIIAGGMLNLHEKNIQVVREEGFFPYPPFRRSLRSCVDISNREELIHNDGPSIHNKNITMYAGWWFCAFPIIYLRNGLSYPFFFQLDDIEFSLRNNSKIIHLNGISVWHAPYWEKINHSKYYYSSRNTLIISAFVFREPFLPLLRTFLQMYKQIFLLNYTSAYYVVSGLKSYNDGPEKLPVSSPWTAKPEIKEVCKKQIVHHEKFDFSTKKNIIKIIISILTWNGHFLPNFILKKNRYVKHQYSIFSNNMLLNHSVFILNEDNLYIKYTISRKEALKCTFLFAKEAIRYFKNYKKISEAWKQTRVKFTSLDWWNQHLELLPKDKHN